MTNFIIGQLVGLVEPFLAIDFIIKCLDWKEQVKHRKQLYIWSLGVFYLICWTMQSRHARKIKKRREFFVGLSEKRTR